MYIPDGMIYDFLLIVGISLNKEQTQRVKYKQVGHVVDDGVCLSWIEYQKTLWYNKMDDFKSLAVQNNKIAAANFTKYSFINASEFYLLIVNIVSWILLKIKHLFWIRPVVEKLIC